MRSMEIIKAITRYGAGLLFRVGILAVPSLLALVTITHNPTFIRQALTDSGIYDSVRSEVLTKSIQSTQDLNGKQLLSDPNTQAIILGAFTPDVLQRSSEQLITDAYRWLDGSASSIQSQLDLTAARDQFLQGITNYTKQRLDSLPQCTLQQMRDLDVSAQGVLNVSCRPLGINVTQTSNEFTQQVRNSTSFLQNPVITIDTGASKQANSNNVQLPQDLPRAYRLLPSVTWVIGVASMIAGGAYLLLSTDKQRAQKVLARWIAGTGVLLCIGVGISEFFIRRYIQYGQTGGATQGFRDSVYSIVRTISSQYHTRLLLIAGVYLVLGLVWWVATRRMQPTQKQ